MEARKRTAEMTKVFHSYTRYTPDRVGEIHDVLMCEVATDGVHLVGHNKQYEHVSGLCSSLPLLILSIRSSFRKDRWPSWADERAFGSRPSPNFT